MAARDTSRARAAAHATRVVGRETMGEDAFARPSSREHGLEEVEVRRAGKAPRLLQAQSIEFVNSTNISPRDLPETGIPSCPPDLLGRVGNT